MSDAQFELGKAHALRDFYRGASEKITVVELVTGVAFMISGYLQSIVFFTYLASFFGGIFLFACTLDFLISRRLIEAEDRFNELYDAKQAA